VPFPPPPPPPSGLLLPCCCAAAGKAGRHEEALALLRDMPPGRVGSEHVVAVAQPAARAGAWGVWRGALAHAQQVRGLGGAFVCGVCVWGEGGGAVG
jgi:hypothetical protein